MEMFSQRPQRTTGFLHRRGSSLDYGTQPSPTDSSPLNPDFIDDALFFSKQFDALTTPRPSPVEKRNDILRLVDVYHKHALTKAHDLRRLLHTSSSQDSMELDESLEPESEEQQRKTLRHWDAEAQTWDLLRRLLPLRFSNATAGPGTRPFQPETSRLWTAAELWDEFMKTDSVAQERKAILQCMQSAANSTRPDIEELVRDHQQRADRGDIIAFGWLHTKSAIKMQKSMNGWGGAIDPSTPGADHMHLDGNADPLVTQLDPDVPTRQARKLQPQDEYFERAIWLGCYELLRRGRTIDEIRDWCIERTEVWRAVSMSAMPLSGDQNECSGCEPLSALLWRRTCFALSRQGGNDDFERAVYGVLAGDIPSVERVCESWDDFVFTHFNALLRSQFDAYLLKRSPKDATSVTQSFSSFNAVQFHGDAATAPERFLGSLESSPKTTAEARTPIKSLQSAIISNKLSQFIYELGLALGQRANKSQFSPLIPSFTEGAGGLDDSRFFTADDYNGMRLAAHIHLVVSSLEQIEEGSLAGNLTHRAAQENVLSTYISTLRLNQQVELIPLYCSKLHGDRAFFTLSRNLTRTTDFETRDMLLRIMERLGMDIAKFVQFQPQSFLQQYPSHGEAYPTLGKLTIFTQESPSLKYGRPLKPDFFGITPDPLPIDDENLIQSLEWFLLVDGLWEDMFRAGTSIYKLFLKNFNLHAARELMFRVPCAEIFKRKAGFDMPVDDDDISWYDELRDSASQGMLDGNDIGSEELAAARSFFEMECLVKSLDSMETIASCEGLAKEQAGRQSGELDREFWNQLGHEVKRIKTLMQPVLSRWLLESTDEDPDFEILREAYLPEVIVGYISVLHFAGTSLSRDNLLECMELSSLIADKDSDVQEVLMKSGRMKDVVEGFANCSKALAISANQNKGSGTASKKMREMGWTRELWAVKGP